MATHLQHLNFRDIEARAVISDREVAVAISEETAARVAGLEALIVTAETMGLEMTRALVDYVQLAGAAKAYTVLRNLEAIKTQDFDRR